MNIIKLSWRNILSWGNEVTTLDFNEQDKLFFKGRNGDGKSSIIDIMYFALYGKILRSNKNSGIINNYTKSNMLTQITVKGIDNNIYTIIRVKQTDTAPIITEIYSNDELLNFDNNEQEFINYNILGCNHTDFRKDCVLEMLPELNKIDMFTFITELNNLQFIDKVAHEYREEQSMLEVENATIELSKTSVANNIETIEKMISEQNKDIDGKIAEIDETINKNNAEILVLTENINKANPLLTGKNNYLMQVENRFNTLCTTRAQLNQQIFFLSEQKKNVDVDVCSCCRQNVSIKHKEEIIKTIDTTIEEYKNNISSMNLAKGEEILNTTRNDINNLRNYINKNTERLSFVKQHNVFLEQTKASYITNRDISKNEKLDELKNNLQEIVNRQQEIHKRYALLNDIVNLVFDDKGYKYERALYFLEEINLFFQKYIDRFTIKNISVFVDAEFNVKISRLGEINDLTMLSKGEQAIVNVIFTLFRLEKQNKRGLKIFDESLDSNLTKENVEILMKIVTELYQTEMIFFISHKMKIPNFCNKRYEVSKEEEYFSCLTQF